MSLRSGMLRDIYKEKEFEESGESKKLQEFRRG